MRHWAPPTSWRRRLPILVLAVAAFASVGATALPAISGASGALLAGGARTDSPSAPSLSTALSPAITPTSQSGTTSPPEWEAGTLTNSIPIGLEPYAIAFDPANGDLYATNAIGDTVSVIDAATSAVIATIPVGSIPQGVAYDSSNGQIFITNSESDNISVIDGATNQLVPLGPNALHLGEYPIGIAYDPSNGELYVANYESNNVSVINGATDSLTTTIAFTATTLPFGVAVDTSNDQVFVSGSESPGTINEINPATNTVTGSPVSLGDEPTGVVFDPTNGLLYVANFGSGSVSVVNGVTDTVVGSAISVAANPEFFAYNGDSSLVYVGTYNDELYAINGTTNAVAATISEQPPAGSDVATRGLAFDPASGDVYAVSADLDSVLVLSALLQIGPASDSIRGTGASGFVSDEITVSGGAGSSVFDTATDDLYVPDSTSDAVSVVSASTDSVVATVLVGTAPVATTADADNGEIYVANSGSDTVSVFNPATGTITATLTVGTEPTALAYDASNGDVYVANEGSASVTVIRGTTNVVLSTIPVGTDPSQVLVDPGNGEVYTANTGSNNLSVIDGATNHVLQSVSIVGNPQGLAYDAASGIVYVSNGLTNNVTLVLPGNVVGANVSVGSDPMGLAFDTANGDLYVTDSGAAELSVVSGSTVVATIGAPAGPESATYDPLNGDLFVGVPGMSEVSVVPTLHDTTTPSDWSLDVGQTLLFSAPVPGIGTGNLTYTLDSSNTTGLACTADPIGVGEVSGACTGDAAGTYTASLSLSDSAGSSVATTQTFLVLTDPTLSAPTVAPSTVDIGQTVQFSVSAAGGTGSYSYGWAGLPAGCASANSATISCEPTASGTFNVHATLHDSDGDRVVGGTASLAISPDPGLAAPTAAPAGLDVGQSTTISVTVASNGSGSDSYTWAGLPTGCTGANAPSLTCSPTSAGVFSVYLTAQDSNGVTVASPTVALVVAPALGPATVVASATSVTVNSVVTFVASASGGSGAYSYVWSGLPSGCAGSNSSAIACTPTSTSGSPFTVSVQITDSNGAKVTGSSTPISVTKASTPASGVPSWLEYTGIGLAALAAILAAVAVVIASRRRDERNRAPPTPYAPPPAAAPAPAAPAPVPPSGASGAVPSWSEEGEPPSGPA